MPVSLDQFLSEIEASIAASEKRAMDEEDTIGGKTSHPSGGAEDGTMPHKDGERAREHDQTVREQEGAVSVNATPDAKADFYSNDRAYEQIGSTATIQGHDPENETAGTKGVQTDEQIGGDTKHPANTENPELGGKYASDQLDKMNVSQLSSVFTKLAEDLCRAVIQDNASATSAQSAQQPSAKEAQDAQQAAQAAQAGWQFADVLDRFDKTAADQLARAMLEQTVREAAAHADMTAQFLLQKVAQAKQEEELAQQAVLQQHAKAAADQAQADLEQRANYWQQWLRAKEAMEELAADPGAAPAGGGDEAELLAAMGGEAPSSEGGAPEGGAGVDDAAQIEALAELLAQLNISPEELEAIVQAQSAGLPAESMPEGTAAPSEGAPKEASDRRRRRTQASREKIAEMIKELAARSRRR